MTTTISTADLAAIRERHERDGSGGATTLGRCHEDRALLLSALTAAEARAAEVERERDEARERAATAEQALGRALRALEKAEAERDTAAVDARHATERAERLAGALRLAARWLGDDDPVAVFEDIATWFRDETGVMRPGKDDMSNGHTEEERQVAWFKWSDAKAKEVRAVVRAALAEEPKGYCHAFDTTCEWAGCPQIRDGEPAKTGRHCPLDDSEGRAGGDG